MAGAGSLFESTPRLVAALATLEALGDGSLAAAARRAYASLRDPDAAAASAAALELALEGAGGEVRTCAEALCLLLRAAAKRGASAADLEAAASEAGAPRVGAALAAAWASDGGGGEALVRSARERLLGPLRLADVTWRANLRVAGSGRGADTAPEPRAVLQLALRGDRPGACVRARRGWEGARFCVSSRDLDTSTLKLLARQLTRTLRAGDGQDRALALSLGRDELRALLGDLERIQHQLDALQ